MKKKAEKTKPMRITGAVLKALGAVEHSEFDERWPRGLMLTTDSILRIMLWQPFVPCVCTPVILTKAGYGQWLKIDHPEAQEKYGLDESDVRDFMEVVRSGGLRSKYRRLMEKAAADHKRKR